MSKKFKRTNRVNLENQMQKNVYEKNKIIRPMGKKAIVIIGLIAIFLSIGVYFSFNKSSKKTAAKDTSGELNVRDANGTFQSNPPVETGKQSIEQNTGNPASPATVKDLGGNNNAPQNIDTLLEGKTIKVNK